MQIYEIILEYQIYLSKDAIHPIHASDELDFLLNQLKT